MPNDLKTADAIADATRAVGKLLLDLTPPPPAGTFGELREAVAVVEEPTVGLLRAELAAIRPGVAWVDEIETEVPDEGEVWVADVTDGVVQFLQGLPQWCVSVALVRNGTAVAVALHNPLLDETYTAALGAGAYRDGQPIRPSAKTDLSVTLVGMTHPPFVRNNPDDIAGTGRLLSNALPVVGAVRNLGPTSWQVADTAAGRMDAFAEYGRDDANLLPGALVAREAGALVTDFDGAPWRAGASSFLAAPPALHGGLLRALR